VGTAAYRDEQLNLTENARRGLELRITRDPRRSSIDSPRPALVFHVSCALSLSLSLSLSRSIDAEKVERENPPHL